MAVAGMFAFAACNNNAKTADEPKTEEQPIEEVQAPVEEQAQDAVEATADAIDAAAEQAVENAEANAEQK